MAESDMQNVDAHRITSANYNTVVWVEMPLSGNNGNTIHCLNGIDCGVTVEWPQRLR
jgi:hypothetical protein